MNKILLGVSAPANKTARTATAVIAEEFNIDHISMRQALINIVATLTAQHPTHQEFSTPQSMAVDYLKGATVGEIEIALGFCLRTINPAYFIERTKEAMKISRSGLNGKLFQGNIITGIRTELEAQWIRDQGGLMIHLYHYDNLSEFYAPKLQDSDLAISITNTPTRNNLIASLSAIKAFLNPNQEAA